MIFTWSRRPDGIRSSRCSACGAEVARSRRQDSLFRAQRAHVTTCIPTVPAHSTRR